MATKSTARKAGQRSNLTTGGAKSRSPVSTSHKGSRVEPSHITKKSRDDREKKVAAAAKKVAKKAAKRKA